MNESQVVDSKVVELSLQNKDFESNAEKSISTIEKLKKSLDFKNAGRGIKDVNANASTLTAGIKTLAGGFDTVSRAASVSIGEIAKIKLVADAVSYVEGKVASLASTFDELTLRQIDAGWNKYAEKTSSVQTIMSATAKEFSKEAQENGEQMEYVNSQLEKLNWFTDETSYNFLDMVGNIGKFTSNNVALDRSVTAMQGISTWAAKSGANVGEASRAMYNLSQAIAVGSVKLMDWKSIENANMATAEFKETAIETAEKLGTLTKVSEGLWKTQKGNEVSVQNFNQSLSDAWFNSEVLLSTLDKYGAFTDQLYEFMDSLEGDVTTSTVLDYIDEYAKSGTLSDFGSAARELGIDVDTLKEKLAVLGSEEMEFGRKAFRAAQEAKTFEEAIDATKDAVSTAWMNTFETLFGNYEEAKVLWTDLANGLWDIFAGPVNNLNDNLKDAFSMQGSATLDDWKSLEDAGLASDGFKTAVIAMAKKHGEITDEMAVDINNIDSAINDGVISVNSLTDAWKLMTSDTSEGAKQTAEDLEKIKAAALDVIRGDYGNNMEERFAKLTEAGYDPQQVQDYVNALHKAAGGTWNLTDEIFEQVNAQFAESVKSVEDMSDAELEALGITKEQVEEFKKLAEESGKAGKAMVDENGNLIWERPSGKELWTETLYNGAAAFTNLLENLSKAKERIFPSSGADGIYSFIVRLNEASKKLADFTKNSTTLRRVFRAFFSIVDILKMTIDGIVSGAIRLVKETGLDKFFIKLVNKVATTVIIFRRWLKETNAIKNVIDFLVDTIGGAVNKIKSWFDAFITLPQVAEGISKFKDAFKTTFKSLPEYAAGTARRLKGFFARTSGLFKNGITFDSVKTAFTDFKKHVLDYIGSFPGFKKFRAAFTHVFGAIKTGLKSLGIDTDSIKTKFNQFVDFVKGLFEKVKSKANEIITAIPAIKDSFLSTISSIFEKLRGIKLPKSFSEFLDIFRKKKKLKADASGVSSIFGGFVEKIKGFFGVLKDFFGDIDLNTIIGLVEAFLAFKAIKFIGGLLGNVSQLLNNMAAKEKAKKLMFMAGAITLLAGAVYILSKIDPKRLWIAVGAVAALGAVMVALDIVLTKMGGNGENLKNAGIGIIAIAGSILILVLALKLMEALNAKKIDKNLKILGLLGLGLMAFIAVLGIVNKAGGSTAGGVGILAAVTSILVLMYALKKLEKFKINDPVSLIKNLIIVFGSLALLLLATRAAGKNSLGAAASIAAIAAALTIMSVALKVISTIKENDLARSLLAMGLLSAMLAALILVSKNASGKSALSLIGLGIAIAAMAASLAALAMIKPARLKSASEAIGIVVGMLTLLSGVTGIFKTSALSMLAIAATIGVIGLVLYQLSKLPVENVSGVVDALEKVFFSLDILMGVLTVTGLFGPAVMNGVVGLLALIAGIGLIIGLLGDFVGQGILGFTNSLPQISTNLSLFAEGIQPFDNVCKGIAASDFDGLKALVGAVIDIAKGEFLDGLYKLFSGGESSVVSFVNKLPTLAQGINSYASALGEGVGDAKVTASAQAIALLASVCSADITAGGLMTLLKGSTGSRIEEFVKQLPVLADGISEYANTIDTATFNDEKINASKSLVTMLSGLTKDTIPDGGVIGLIKGNGYKIKDFGSQLPVLASGLSSYASTIDTTTFNDEKLNASKNLITMLSGLTKDTIPDGGVIGLIKGNGYKIKDFGSQLPVLASGLSSYANTIDTTTFNNEKLTASENLAKMLGSIASENIPDGGLIGALQGNNTKIIDFAKQLPSLAEGLATYAVKIDTTTFTKDKIEASENLAKMLGSIARENIPDGGIIGKLTGNKDKITDFANQLPSLAEGLASYAVKIDNATFSKDKIDASKNLATILSELANEQIPSGGLLGWLSGNDVKITDFASQLEPLAEGLSGFVAALSDEITETEKVSAAGRAIYILGAMANNADAFGWINNVQMSTFKQNLADLGEGLNTFSTKIEDESKLSTIVSATKKLLVWQGDLKDINLSEGDITDDQKVGTICANIAYLVQKIESLATMDTSGIDKIKDATTTLSTTDFSTLNTDVSSAASGVGDSLNSGLAEKATDVSNTMSSIMQGAGNAARNSYASFQRIGRQVIRYILIGLNEKKGDVSSTMQSVMSSTVSAVSGRVSQFSSMGRYVVLGFASGIQLHAYIASKAASEMARQALEAVRRAINAHSPSKETEKLGSYFGMGFVNSLEDYQSIAYGSAYGVGDAAKDGLSRAIEGVNSILTSDFDGGPVIRPVLDLSEIQNGAGLIGNMLSVDEPIGIMGSLNTISYNNRYTRNSSNDILDALASLEHTLGSQRGGDTYIVDGVTYDDGSNIASAVGSLIQAAKVGRRM